MKGHIFPVSVLVLKHTGICERAAPMTVALALGRKGKEKCSYGLSALPLTAKTKSQKCNLYNFPFTPFPFTRSAANN